MLNLPMIVAPRAVSAPARPSNAANRSARPTATAEEPQKKRRCPSPTGQSFYWKMLEFDNTPTVLKGESLSLPSPAAATSAKKCTDSPTIEIWHFNAGASKRKQQRQWSADTLFPSNSMFGHAKLRPLVIADKD